MRVFISPTVLRVGSQAPVRVFAESQKPIGAYQITIRYRPIRAVAVGGATTGPGAVNVSPPGLVRMAGAFVQGQQGRILLGIVSFEGRKSGQVPLSISGELYDVLGELLPVQAEDSMLTVEGGDEIVEHVEREFEIGRDEAWFANVKRTYDEYQQESLQTIRELRTLFTKLVTDAQQHDNQRQNIANQALQNAVETANMVAKQAVRHADLAIDRQWNIDEVAQLVAKTPVFLDAISAAVTAAVNEHVAKEHRRSP